MNDSNNKTLNSLVEMDNQHYLQIAKLFKSLKLDRSKYIELLFKFLIQVYEPNYRFDLSYNSISDLISIVENENDELVLAELFKDCLESAKQSDRTYVITNARLLFKVKYYIRKYNCSKNDDGVTDDSKIMNVFYIFSYFRKLETYLIDFLIDSFELDKESVNIAITIINNHFGTVKANRTMFLKDYVVFIGQDKQMLEKLSLLFTCENLPRNLSSQKYFNDVFYDLWFCISKYPDLVDKYVHTVDIFGNNCLHHFARIGQLKTITYVLDKYPEVDINLMSYNEIVPSISFGYDLVENHERFGKTPLHWAVYSEGTTKLLLDRGADPNLCDKYGLTADDWKRIANEDRETCIYE